MLNKAVVTMVNLYTQLYPLNNLWKKGRIIITIAMGYIISKTGTEIFKMLFNPTLANTMLEMHKMVVQHL